jgi:hypothetical protein
MVATFSLVLAHTTSQASNLSRADRPLLAEAVRPRPGEWTQSSSTRRQFNPALSNEGRLPAAPQGACSAQEEVALAGSSTDETMSQLQQVSVALPGGGFGVVWEEGRWPERNVRMQVTGETTSCGRSRAG